MKGMATESCRDHTNGRDASFHGWYAAVTWASVSDISSVSNISTVSVIFSVRNMSTREPRFRIKPYFKRKRMALEKTKHAAVPVQKKNNSYHHPAAMQEQPQHPMQPVLSINDEPSNLRDNSRFDFVETMDDEEWFNISKELDETIQNRGRGLGTSDPAPSAPPTEQFSYFQRQGIRCIPMPLTKEIVLGMDNDEDCHAFTVSSFRAGEVVFIDDSCLAYHHSDLRLSEMSEPWCDGPDDISLLASAMKQERVGSGYLLYYLPHQKTALSFQLCVLRMRTDREAVRKAACIAGWDGLGDGCREDDVALLAAKMKRCAVYGPGIGEEESWKPKELQVHSCFHNGAGKPRSKGKRSRKYRKTNKAAPLPDGMASIDPTQRPKTNASYFAISSVAASINPQCSDGNVRMELMQRDPQLDGRCSFSVVGIATRDIAFGDELRRAPPGPDLSHMNAFFRQLNLFRQHYLFCTCSRCEKEIHPNGTPLKSRDLNNAPNERAVAEIERFYTLRRQALMPRLTDVASLHQFASRSKCFFE